MTKSNICLNINHGTEVSKKFLEDVEVLGQISADLYREVLEKSVVLIKEKNRKEKTEFNNWLDERDDKIDLEAAIKVSYFFLQQAVGFNLTKEGLIEDFDKLGLSAEVQSIIIEYLDKNRVY